MSGRSFLDKNNLATFRAILLNPKASGISINYSKVYGNSSDISFYSTISISPIFSSTAPLISKASLNL
jgi:hypothetical protein